MLRGRALASLVLTVVLIAACWLSSGLAPLTDAAAGARDPVDFARDYVSARALLEDGSGPPPEGDAGNARADRLGAPRVELLGGPYYIHPPTATLVVLPLARLSWHAAARAWALLSLAALVWLAWSLERIWSSGRPPAAWRFGLLAALLPFWPPALHCLEKGQWSIGLAALLAAGYRALERERATRAGALFSVAAALKATPVVRLGLLAARNRRAAAVMALGVAALALLATALDGGAAWRAFFGGASLNAEVWATWLANTASLQGVFARLWTAGPFTRPLVVAPALSRGAFLATSAVLLAAAGAVSVGWLRRRARGEGDGRARACWSAAWMALPVLLNPLGWTHVAVMLLVPIAVALRDGRAGARVVAALALAALSIPRTSLVAWAGPLPLAPLPALAVGTHAFAAVALYLALLVEGASKSSAPPGRAYQ
ncbi:MAG TPA: glycosyltransferase family 87 protein [Polyangia bacterium]|nr:glycosyltransferase family 87 protein [Polyangia bacterium]